jgi:hypothetical protein
MVVRTVLGLIVGYRPPVRNGRFPRHETTVFSLLDRRTHRYGLIGTSNYMYSIKLASIGTILVEVDELGKR